MRHLLNIAFAMAGLASRFSDVVGVENALKLPYAAKQSDIYVSTLAGTYSQPKIVCANSDSYDGLGTITCSVPPSQASLPSEGDRVGNLAIAIPRKTPFLGFQETSCVPTKLAYFDVPRGVAILPDERTILVADQNSIRKVEMDRSNISTLQGSPGCCCFIPSAPQSSSQRFTSLQYITSSPDGTLAFATDAETKDPLIQINLLTGETKRTLSGMVLGGLAVLGNGSIILVNTGLNRVEIFTWDTGQNSVLSGQLDGVGGFVDGVGTAARFNMPTSLAKTYDETAVFVVDQSDQSVVRRIDINNGNTQCWIRDSLQTVSPPTCKYVPSADQSWVFGGIAVTPDGNNLILLDKLNNKIVSFSLKDSTLLPLAGSTSGTEGYSDGSAGSALFMQPAGLAIGSSGQYIIVSESLEHKSSTVFPRLRTVAICSSDICPFGQWRGPCNAAFRGACLNCSAPPFAVYTSASNPFDRDTCGWDCIVGYYQSQKFVCSQCRNPIPGNSAFVSAGPPFSAATIQKTESLGGNCSWRCNTGYFAQDNKCIPVRTSFCEHGNVTFTSPICHRAFFPVSSCAGSKHAHEKAMQEISDTNFTDSACLEYFKAMCERFGGIPAPNPDCSILCAEQILDVWHGYPLCSVDSQCPNPPQSLRRTVCCNYLSAMIRSSCSNYDASRLAQLDPNIAIGGVKAVNLSNLCTLSTECIFISAAPRQLQASLRQQFILGIIPVMWIILLAWR